MKNLINLLCLLTVLFYSCAKEGETGPQGPAGQNGTNGTNGNANVHSYFSDNPASSQWIYSSIYNQYMYDFSVPQITDEIIRNGTVNVFFGQKNITTGDSVLTPLPNIGYNGTYIQYWTCRIMPGRVTVYYGWNGTTTVNPGSYYGYAFFKFAVIEGHQRKNLNSSRLISAD